MSSMPLVGSHASLNAKLHRVISSLSPMKKSKTCSNLEREVTDGESYMWLFSFDAGVCKKLALNAESKAPVVISNCKVRNPRRWNNLEVYVDKNTDLSNSDKHLDLKTSPAAVTM